MDAFYINLKKKIDSSLWNLYRRDIDYPKYKISSEIGIVTEKNAIENLKKFLIYDFQIIKGEECTFEYDIITNHGPWCHQKRNGFYIYIIYFSLDNNCYINAIPSYIYSRRRDDYPDCKYPNLNGKIYFGFELYIKPFLQFSKNETQKRDSDVFAFTEHLEYIIVYSSVYRYIDTPSIYFENNHILLKKISNKIEFNITNSLILNNEIEIHKKELFKNNVYEKYYALLPIKFNLNDIYNKIILHEENEERSKINTESIKIFKEILQQKKFEMENIIWEQKNLLRKEEYERSKINTESIKIFKEILQQKKFEMEHIISEQKKILKNEEYERKYINDDSMITLENEAIECCKNIFATFYFFNIAFEIIKKSLSDENNFNYFYHKLTKKIIKNICEQNRYNCDFNNGIIGACQQIIMKYIEMNIKEFSELEIIYMEQYSKGIKNFELCENTWLFRKNTKH
jgi:hypothetical protein